MIWFSRTSPRTTPDRPFCPSPLWLQELRLERYKRWARILGGDA